MARIPTITGVAGRQPIRVGVPSAQVRVPTPTGGIAIARGLASAGAAIASIGIANQQAARVNALNDWKLRILQATDQASQTADEAAPGSQVDAFNGIMDSLLQDSEQEIEEEDLRGAVQLSIEVNRVQRQPKFRAMESRKLGEQAQAQTLSMRPILLAEAIAGSEAESQNAILEWETHTNSRVDSGTMSDPQAIAANFDFNAEVIKGRAISLADTNPVAALELLETDIAKEHLSSATRDSLVRTIEARHRQEQRSDADTLVREAGRIVSELFTEDHQDPEVIGSNISAIAQELASHPAITATAEEVELSLLQPAIANAAQTGDWAMVQLLKPILSKTLEGQTVFDKMRDKALVAIRSSRRATILQAAAEGNANLSDIESHMLDAGRRFVEDPNDPLGMPPDLAQSIVNQSEALLNDKDNSDAIGVLYRANQLLPGAGTKATQKIVDEQFPVMLEVALRERGLSPDTATRADLILATGDVVGLTNRTGVFATAVKETIEGSVRSDKTISEAVDLAVQLKQNAPATYKLEISSDARAMVDQFLLFKRPNVPVEEAWESANQQVFKVSPVRAAAFVQAEKNGFSKRVFESLLKSINERLDLDLDAEDISTQVSPASLAIVQLDAKAGFLRTGNEDSATRQALERFFERHGLTKIDSQPRLMEFAPELIYGRGKGVWDTDGMLAELSEDIVGAILDRTLILAEGVEGPVMPERTVFVRIGRTDISREIKRTRSDEEMAVARREAVARWIQKNVVLEPDENSIILTSRGPLPTYLMMTMDKNGILSAINISRGDMAPVAFRWDPSYENSRANREAVADATAQARADNIKHNRTRNFRTRVTDDLNKFSLFPAF